jgi:para-nitrobenzyl esterase
MKLQLRLVGASILSLFAFSAAPVATAASAIGEVVQVKGGKISGITVEDGGEKVYLFKAVPYAAPPVGNLRWKAPEPAKPWNGVRDATKWSAQCPQRAGSSMGEPGSISEDCLYLNVVTAAKNVDEKRPVMVFFHGGGLTTGTGNSTTYANTALPRKGVVVVTVNSRLGPIGYMAHPALSKESGRNASGNYGTLDLIASLRWVKDNIRQFGGDPNNVLIFGESGGGSKTLSVLSAPMSKGLFHKAIVESGSALSSPARTTTLEKGEAAGQRISAKLGLDKSADELAALRAAKWEDVIAAAGDRAVDFNANVVVDGYILPQSVHDTLKNGKQHDVPMIVGANEGEQRELQETVPMLGNLMSNTAKSKVYVYNFAHVPKGWRDLPCVAFHGLELPYVFGNIPDGLKSPTILFLSRGGGCNTRDAGSDQTDVEVADNTMRMWAAFAKTGDPSVKGLIQWPEYTESSDQYLRIGQKLEVKKGVKTSFVAPPAGATPPNAAPTATPPNPSAATN